MSKAGMFRISSMLVWFFFSFPLAPSISAAGALKDPSTASVQGNPKEAMRPFWSRIESRWSGKVDAIVAVSWPDERTYFQPVGTGLFGDGRIALRLINQTAITENVDFEIHYQTIFETGDRVRRKLRLKSLFPQLKAGAFLFGVALEDDRRLLDLTARLQQAGRLVWLNRLDRLSLGWHPPWGNVRIGRQALTWGNGLIFNPMDLFNPFAPTDIEQDYKLGDDMVTAQVNISGIGDFQALYVARRSPQSGDVEFNESSLAMKMHLAAGTTEFDLLGARHFEDHVVGVGSSGYLGDAAWRVDATWTMLKNPGGQGPDGYLSLVANMDYSWNWWGRNFYGLMEYYHNGLGESDPSRALSKEPLLDRLARGELFVIGRNYLAGEIRVELHPLFNVFLTIIANIEDPSGIMQPRAVWSITQDMELKFGLNIAWGAKGTEFGGFSIPAARLRTRSPDSAFVWLTYYF